MFHRALLLALFCLGSVVGLPALADSCTVAPHDPGCQRDLLYPPGLDGELAEVVAPIRDLGAPTVPYEALERQGEYLVRIAPRQYVLDADNQLLDNAILGTKPMVFVTTPESLHGKPLLDIYLDIGYEAEDIIRWQRDTDMVAIVFRYPASVEFTPVLDGDLPTPVTDYVIVPTWDNMFTLFARLSENAEIKSGQEGEFQPTTLFFRDEAERQLVLGFPASGEQRIKDTGYITLRENGGSDWAYRDLLEKKLSVFEHFRGNGRTLNEIVDPRGVHHEAGLLEFVGPNYRLKELPEVAVVHLGALTLGTDYADAAD